MIIINTGDGKGKTTAAIGQAVRAAGNNLTVKIVQFIKDGDSGEINAIRLMQSAGLKIDFEQTGAGFTKQGDKQAHVNAAKTGLQIVTEALDKYDMVIADEINYAVSGSLIDEADVLKLIESAKEKDKHFIMTGRGATEKMINAADIVTEMKKNKHAYDSGVKAQKGIEF